MPESVRFSIEEPSQIAEARRFARRMAQGIGFGDVRCEQVAIAVTEACTNLLKHAGGGEIVLSEMHRFGRQSPDLEMLALDKGPGMDNLNKCLESGYSTGASPGQGLGAIVRLTDECDFHTGPGQGTGVLARWAGMKAASDVPAGNPHVLRIGAVSVSKRGEEFCGDSWAVEQTAETTTVLVADGLGHGYDASVASAGAVRVLRENPELPPLALIDLCHRALRSSRGAAISVARIDRVRGTLSFCGVGNVSAQICLGAEHQQHLVSGNGTAGHQIQRIREYSYQWPEDGILLLHSDGLSASTGLAGRAALALRDPSLIAGVLYRDFSRGQDDATVVVAKV